MYHFFETIRYSNGRLQNLIFHQYRMEKTFNYFKKLCQIKLVNITPQKYNLEEEIYKCKIQYNLENEFKVEFIPYKSKKIITISLVHTHNTYNHKYINRQWIDEALISAGTDEIILIKNKLITDTSIANLVFFNGKSWITPATPLLKGTHRERLLKKKKIFEQLITIDKVKEYQAIKLINAMQPWHSSLFINPIQILK